MVTKSEPKNIRGEETRRERQRNATLAEIKAFAREQMQTSGAATLSLRQIAERMGMTVGALYRYYENRDAVITALIVDAFNSFADALAAVDSAIAAVTPTAYRERMHALFIEYRVWALRNAVDYQLIYGDPIPGYHAPGNITVPAAARVFVPIVDCLDQALSAGAIHPHLSSIPDPDLHDHLVRSIVEYAALLETRTIQPLAFYLAVDAWTRGHGLITLEMHGHTPPVVGDPDLFYRVQIDQLLQWLGF